MAEAAQHVPEAIYSDSETQNRSSQIVTTIPEEQQRDQSSILPQGEFHLLMASSRFLGSVLLLKTLSVIAVLLILARKWVHLDGSMFSLGANPVTIL